ncbi:penicillin-binding transpeptidase domain-containing protein [Nocardioides sp. CFH 31398]|uniref:penicillin-binding transpeptidase domain-containing protein n=1 Tax=Nocardioides sp. CFH 31398 TaxID=2919579 RepID=UPI001F059EE8|nr:penicillin-binding transpeptidase domain-containing protein [Nocardioides sp. CFH 31398]MCH1865326.1 penicillin-binding protein [Nocardioides sp. CFH 31398]
MSRSPGRLAACAVLALALAACSGQPAEEEDPTAEAAEVADLLAEQLSDHTLDGVPLVDFASQEDFAELVEPLDDQQVVVEAGEVEAEGATARAPLAWTWEIAGQEWAYETTANLTEVEGAWLVDWRPGTLAAGLRPQDRLGLFSTTGERGRILGAGRQPIVVDREVRRYGLDKTRVGGARQTTDSARRIARGLGIEVAPYVDEVRRSGDEAFVEALVLRPEDARELVPGDFGDIPGSAAVVDTLPLAPTREFAAPILGRVGEATAEVVESSDGEIEAGDVVGLSGLQLRYDEQLRSIDGAEVVAAGSSDERRELFVARATDGEDLRTTLDLDAQRAAERVLADGVPADVPSALVALRPSDGAVLAAASGPGSEGFSTATEGRYAPGSTMKVVTALALLRSGLTPQDTVACPPGIDVDGRTFTNYDDYPAAGLGDVTLTRALADSCNTAFIGAGVERLGGRDLAEAAAALGLGEDADVGFTSFFGEVPQPEGATDEAASMIGQGRVLASPLAMAAVAASVAAGERVVPSLVPEVEAEATDPAEPLTAAEARSLRTMMRTVVTDGSGSVLAGLPGEVGAKTGTAEYGEAGGDGDLPTHAWMIATRGDLAVAVFVETGTSGSVTAGPLVERFLSAVR